jgi:DNA-directed RNA polymerase subunit RPC12/RpoP
VARLILAVRCASCGQEFDTGIRMDRRNFMRATLAANYHVCPGCGRRGSYQKSDYLLHDEQNGFRPAPPDTAP